MSAKFKTGDRATIECYIQSQHNDASYVVFDNCHGVWVKTGDLRHVTPTPAPKAEREAVPSDARVGDVYGCEARSSRVEVTKVYEGVDAGSYDVHSTDGERVGYHVKGEHAGAPGWYLLKRGPEPKPAIPPEPAKCGDKRGPFTCEIRKGHLSEMHRDGAALWNDEAAKEVPPAVVTRMLDALAAIPPARGERETVGYRIRPGNASGGDFCWSDYCRRWTACKSESTLYPTFKDAAKDCGQIVALTRVVRVTRARKAGTK